MLADLRAAGLACTPSFAMLLAERGAADGVLDEIHLRYGVHGAEPWSESFRQKLQAAWGGEYDACDIYGLSEVIGPGWQWNAEKGKVLSTSSTTTSIRRCWTCTRWSPPPRTPTANSFSPLSRRRPSLSSGIGPDVTRFVAEPCACGRTHRRIARFTGRVDDMLVIRGVNVFPSEIEAVLLDDPALGSQYAIVIDRTGTLPQLEVRAEVASVEFTARKEEIAGRLQERLAQRLRLRVQAIVGEPETIPRQETGKAKRVFERTADQEPFPRPNELGNT